MDESTSVSIRLSFVLHDMFPHLRLIARGAKKIEFLDATDHKQT